MVKFLRLFVFLLPLILSSSFALENDTLFYKGNYSVILDSIVIKGNDITEESIIIRELTFSIGDTLNPNLAEYNRDAIEIKVPEILTETKYNFYSFELGHHKPDPRIYQEVCARLSMHPAKFVFIDDRVPRHFFKCWFLLF